VTAAAVAVVVVAVLVVVVAVVVAVAVAAVAVVEVVDTGTVGTSTSFRTGDVPITRIGYKFFPRQALSNDGYSPCLDSRHSKSESTRASPKNIVTDLFN
jgi:hypothetical protein